MLGFLRKFDRRRSILSYSKVQSLIGSAIRNKQAFARIKSPGCYLDLGCGPNTDPDFCNLDYNWRPDIDVCWDVTKRLPFPDRHISGIFTEHMIEHVPFDAALNLLKECRRILRPGGVLRIVVPDGELYLAEYAKHHAGQKCEIPYAENDQDRFSFVTPMISVNRIFRSHGHLFMWDFETFNTALHMAGFTNVDRRSFGEGADPRLLRDAADRRIESLYLEAT